MTTFGGIIIKKCPHCSALVSEFELSSVFIREKHAWTDGLIFLDGYPYYPSIAMCHNCAGYYWVADAEVVGEIPLPREEMKRVIDQHPDWEKVPLIRGVNEDGYWDALASGLASTREKEKKLRVLIWWKSNDPFRDNPEPAEIPRSSDAMLNLERLIELFCENEPGDMLYRAEALRQLGRFDESIAVLELISATEVRAARYQIMQLASENSSGLARLEDLGSRWRGRGTDWPSTADQGSDQKSRWLVIARQNDG